MTQPKSKLDQPTIIDLNSDLLEITQASIAAADLLSENIAGPPLADALESLATSFSRFTRKMKAQIEAGKLS